MVNFLVFNILHELILTIAVYHVLDLGQSNPLFVILFISDWDFL